MNKYIFPVLVSVSLLFGFKPKPVQTMAEQVKWNEKDHQFGDIQIGPTAEFVFVFKNTGKNPVTISKVEPGCSCTLSAFTSDPVSKGKKGKITISYATKDKPGFFKKGVLVTFADNSVQNLTITGNVKIP